LRQGQREGEVPAGYSLGGVRAIEHWDEVGDCGVEQDAREWSRSPDGSSISPGRALVDLSRDHEEAG
jgi:hypothetical protein